MAERKPTPAEIEARRLMYGYSVWDPDGRPGWYMESDAGYKNAVSFLLHLADRIRAEREAEAKQGDRPANEHD